MLQFILIVKHPYSIVWWHVKAFMEFGVLIRAMMEDMAQSEVAIGINLWDMHKWKLWRIRCRPGWR